MNDAAREARVLVIPSTGRHFCAGMALDVFGAEDALLSTATPRARLRFRHRRMEGQRRRRIHRAGAVVKG